ncbi:MAG: hypothetical protein ABF792_08665 [Bifidobacterium psychraerophilum]|uniref:hypothetical protein n=1 Tax=Bifidobacterium psychraerophilum TaxID=218140 RepID=UPI0039EC10C7
MIIQNLNWSVMFDGLSSLATFAAAVIALRVSARSRREYRESITRQKKMKAIDLAMSLYCDLERMETKLSDRDNSETVAKANTEMAVLAIYGWDAPTENVNTFTVSKIYKPSLLTFVRGQLDS